jgi:anti-sigma-K factor RskA
VGLLALKPETETAVFFTTDLEPLTVDETYQLWILRDEAALSAGIFNVNEQGIGVLEVSEATINLVDLFDTSFDAVGVSIEPAGGSEQPTRVIMLGAASY